MGELEGFVSVAFAVILFGIFPLTTKSFPTADGVFFQLCMCAGIFTIGCIVFVVQCTVGSNSGIASTAHSCPQMEPLAAFGGAIWCLSNMLLCPLVNAWGVGLTMMTWGMAEMFTGWGTGRFGLFGLNKESVKNPVENSKAVAIALSALIVLGLAQPAVSDGSDKLPLLSTIAFPASPPFVATGNEFYGTTGGGGREGAKWGQNGKGDGKYGTLKDTTSGQGDIACVDDESSPLNASSIASAATEADFAEHGYDFVRYLSPKHKRAFGLCGSILAGMLSGSTFTPSQAIIDRNESARAAGTGAADLPFPGASTALLDQLFSHFSGIMFASIAFTMLYVGFSRGKPWISANLMAPAYASGLIWGLAMVCWFVANANLQIVVAFPLVTVGPGIVNMVIGAAWFREVQGSRNIILLFSSTGLYIVAAILISLSGSG